MDTGKLVYCKEEESPPPGVKLLIQFVPPLVPKSNVTMGVC
jgi:hypothetical protein